jgi:hypothetical protein
MQDLTRSDDTFRRKLECCHNREVAALRSARLWVMVVLAALAALTIVLLLAADYVEDAFGTPLASPRDPVGVVIVFMVGMWNALPVAMAAIAYYERVLGAFVALGIAVVSPACVLYAANEVAQDPDGSFIRLAYVFVPFWPIVLCSSIVLGFMWSKHRRDRAPTNRP